MARATVMLQYLIQDSYIWYVLSVQKKKKIIIINLIIVL